MKKQTKKQVMVGVIILAIALAIFILYAFGGFGNKPLSIFGYGGFPDPTIQAYGDTYTMTFSVTPNKIQGGIVTDSDLTFDYSSAWVNPNEYPEPGQETAPPRTDIQFIKYNISNMRVTSISGLNGYGTNQVTNCPECIIFVKDYGSYCTPKLSQFYYQHTASSGVQRLSFDCHFVGEFDSSPRASAYLVDSSATLSFDVVVLKTGIQCTESQLSNCKTGQVCINNLCTEQTKTYYRFQNNTCNLISLLSSQKTISDYDTLTSCQANIIVEPPVVQSKGFIYWIQQLNQWITDFFKKIFGLSIAGLSEVEPNTQATYEINLSTSPADSNFSDSSYSVKFANWAVTDSVGNIKMQGTWEKIPNGKYVKNVTITTPSQIGNYMILGMITETNMTYDGFNHAWIVGEEKAILQEGIDLETKFRVTSPPTVSPSGFLKFIQSIIDWFKNLFGIK